MKSGVRVIVTLREDQRAWLRQMAIDFMLMRDETKTDISAILRSVLDDYRKTKKVTKRRGD